MKKNTILKVGKPLYLNANLVYSETLKLIRKNPRNIKTGTLLKLKEEGYNLITSILTRMEVMQNLKKEENLNNKKARISYNKVLEFFNIAEITNINSYIILNAPFVDNIACTKLDFKDALHISIAKKLDIPLCTHDKKAKKNSIQHESKKGFYNKIYKPEELIKSKN